MAIFARVLKYVVCIFSGVVTTWVLLHVVVALTVEGADEQDRFFGHWMPAILIFGAVFTGLVIYWSERRSAREAAENRFVTIALDWIFGSLAAIGLLLAIVVHVAALNGLDVGERFPIIWLLFGGAVIAFAAFTSCYRSRFGHNPDWSDIREGFPDWVIMATILAIVYGVIGTLVGFSRQPLYGVPNRDGDKYELISHGAFVGAISEAQYHAYEASSLVGFSSMWLVFYSLPCAYFIFRNKQT